MPLSIKQRERERRALEYACPNRLCNAPEGQACAAVRSSGRIGSFRYAGPRKHPHKERIALVPDWTEKS